MCIIQKHVRRKLALIYVYSRGPAIKTKKCINETDFLTLEPFENMHIKDFFSYTDVDGYTFGFDFNSINGLIKRNKNPINPYNRKAIPKIIIKNIKKIRRMNKIYYPDVNTLENIILNNVDNGMRNNSLVALERLRINKTFNERVSNIFYDIDLLGNYTSPEWLIELSRDKLIEFIKFLYELWNYRANIDPQTKKYICPYFNPFYYQDLCSTFALNLYINPLREIAISICENMFYTAINDEYKKLSAIYILTALTTVSNSARNAIPWLYDSTL